MSDQGTAEVGQTLPGRYGGSGGGVTLGEVPLARCWNVQGVAANTEFADEFQRRFGMSLPEANKALAGDAWTALWLGPKSWLLVARDAAPMAPSPYFTATRDGLNGHGGALFDVSASRVAFVVSGRHAATTLAKNCPIDLHDSAFPPGACAQSLVGHVNALLYRPGADATFIVMPARSLARDVWRALCVSAAPQGYEVVAATSFASLEARSAA